MYKEEIRIQAKIREINQGLKLFFLFKWFSTRFLMLSNSTRLSELKNAIKMYNSPLIRGMEPNHFLLEQDEISVPTANWGFLCTNKMIPRVKLRADMTF